MRPMAVSAFTLRRNCCRWRTVSADLVEQIGQRAADLALDVHAHHDELEVDRAEALGHAPAARRRSGGPAGPRSRPGRTRGLVGSEPSRITVSIAWFHEWPAFSDAAIATSVSGSWSLERLLALPRRQLQAQDRQRRTPSANRPSTNSGKTPAKPGRHAEQQRGSRAACRTPRRCAAAGRPARSAGAVFFQNWRPPSTRLGRAREADVQRRRCSLDSLVELALRELGVALELLAQAALRARAEDQVIPTRIRRTRRRRRANDDHAERVTPLRHEPLSVRRVGCLAGGVAGAWR